MRNNFKIACPNLKNRQVEFPNLRKIFENTVYRDDILSAKLNSLKVNVDKIYFETNFSKKIFTFGAMGEGIVKF